MATSIILSPDWERELLQALSYPNRVNEMIEQYNSYGFTPALHLKYSCSPEQAASRFLIHILQDRQTFVQLLLLLEYSKYKIKKTSEEYLQLYTDVMLVHPNLPNKGENNVSRESKTRGPEPSARPIMATPSLSETNLIDNSVTNHIYVNPPGRVSLKRKFQAPPAQTNTVQVQPPSPVLQWPSPVAKGVKPEAAPYNAKQFEVKFPCAPPLENNRNSLIEHLLKPGMLNKIIAIVAQAPELDLGRDTIKLIRLGDQDILSSYFDTHPELIRRLSYFMFGFKLISLETNMLIICGTPMDTNIDKYIAQVKQIRKRIEDTRGAPLNQPPKQVISELPPPPKVAPREPTFNNSMFYHGIEISKDVKNEHIAGTYETKCTTCMVNAVNAVFLPCGHECNCFTCARELVATNPICPFGCGELIGVLNPIIPKNN